MRRSIRAAPMTERFTGLGTMYVGETIYRDVRVEFDVIPSPRDTIVLTSATLCELRRDIGDRLMQVGPSSLRLWSDLEIDFYTIAFDWRTQQAQLRVTCVRQHGCGGRAIVLESDDSED